MSSAVLQRPAIPATQPQPAGLGLRRLPLLVWPSGFVAGFALVAFAVEMVLLRTMPDHVFSMPGKVGLVGAGVLLWFWWTAAWVFWGLARGTQELARRCPRPVAWGLWLLLILGLSLGVIAYASSWGLYLRSGRFTNLEAVIFGVENARTGWFWEYMKQAELKYIWILAGLFAGCLVVVPLSTWLALRSRPAEPVRSMPRFLLWAWFGVVLMLLNYKWVVNDRTVRTERREMLADMLKNRVNPVVTLGSSVVDLVLEEPIEPRLDTAALQPLDTDFALPEGRKLPSVLIVAIESLRNDVVHLKHQGREVMPNLNALAKKGLHCTRAYSQSTHSDYADVCIVSSLYPLRTRRHHFYRTTDPWPKTCIYDVLKKAGHGTAIISSQNESWGSMDRFLQSPNLDLFYDAERSDHQEAFFSKRDTGLAAAIHNKELSKGKLTDKHTTDTAIAWITEQVQQGKPYCLSLNFQSSHFPYELPPGREQPFQPCAIDFDASFLHYPEDKVEVVRNAYYNALYESDKHLGRVVEALMAMGKLDDTILVVLGENGEAFWERGTVTHAREPIEPTVRVACVLHAPGRLGTGALDYPIELIDVVPTVFGLMGLPPHPNFQGIDFLAKDRVPAEERLLFLHAETGLARTEAVILGGRWKLMVDRLRGGGVTLYDLANDPGEVNDLAAQKPDLTKRLRELVATWRQNQLTYYHFSRYYGQFYPPPPPRWQGPAPH